MLVVHRLAGILLQVQAFDADFDVLEIALAIGAERNDDLAFADDRILELRDLVALRQVGIKIVLAVENRTLVDLRLEAETGTHRLADTFLVDHRQHAGHGGIDERHVGIGRLAELGRGPGEELGLAQDLRMDFHADDDFPVASGTGNKALRIGCADVNKGHLTLVIGCFFRSVR